jgi:hypothetical protein
MIRLEFDGYATLNVWVDDEMLTHLIQECAAALPPDIAAPIGESIAFDSRIRESRAVIAG